jgi:hypothetical protein
LRSGSWQAQNVVRPFLKLDGSMPLTFFVGSDPIFRKFEIRNLMMVYLEGDDEEIERPRRNPVLDILREDEDAERFQLMEDCLA